MVITCLIFIKCQSNQEYISDNHFSYAASGIDLSIGKSCVALCQDSIIKSLFIRVVHEEATQIELEKYHMIIDIGRNRVYSNKYLPEVKIDSICLCEYSQSESIESIHIMLIDKEKDIIYSWGSDNSYNLSNIKEIKIKLLYNIDYFDNRFKINLE